MEDSFFIKQMKGVKPLKNKLNETSPDNIKKRNISKKNENKLTENKLTENKQDKHIKNKKSDFQISFSEVNKNLKKGKINIDRRIDLHGYTLLDAYDIFKKEVLKSYNRNKRCLLIITGKGLRINKDNANEHYNDVKPKLYHGKIKNSIMSWINEEGLKEYILTYQNAGAEHGGEGAIFVYLRKKRN